MRLVAGYLVPESNRDAIVCGRCEVNMDPARGYQGGAGVVRVRDRRGVSHATFVCEFCAAVLRRKQQSGVSPHASAT